MKKVIVSAAILYSLSGCATAIIDYQPKGDGEFPELVIATGDSVVKINGSKIDSKVESEKNTIGNNNGAKLGDD